jgi:hypothetical protein
MQAFVDFIFQPGKMGIDDEKSFQLMVARLLVATFGWGGAAAWSGCSTYVTVQWGDTLAASPNNAARRFSDQAETRLGWWVYAGQVLHPRDSHLSSYPPSSTYVVQPGTQGKLQPVLVSCMPYCQPPDQKRAIYAGQVIYLPKVPISTPSNPLPITSSQPYNCPPPLWVMDSTLKMPTWDVYSQRSKWKSAWIRTQQGDCLLLFKLRLE